MRRRTVIAVIAALVVFALSLTTVAGCMGDKARHKAVKPALGAWISGVKAMAEADDGFPAERAVNNQGMAGTAGRTHVHSNEEKTMWRRTADADDAGVYIDFDLGRVHPLGEMWIWNYNAKNPETGDSMHRYGLKQVRIYVSVDREQWSEWKGDGYPFRFAAADGSRALQATNLDDGKRSPVRFDGVPARYVRIVADNEPGVGNWMEADNGSDGGSSGGSRVGSGGGSSGESGGGSGGSGGSSGGSSGESNGGASGESGSGSGGSVGSSGESNGGASGESGSGAGGTKSIFGLSEVRFYRYALQVEQDGMIVPLSASIDADASDSGAADLSGDPENAINNFGMSAYGGKKDWHNDDRRAMWLVPASSVKPVSLTVDLGGTYPLKEMHVWNYNERGKETSGLRHFRLFVSLDGLQWQERKGPGYPYELAIADGSERLKATNLNDGKHSPIDLEGVAARFVKVVPDADTEKRNWGAADGAFGLSELRFYAGSGLAAEPAADWEALFSNYNGWSGADGIFSIPLNGYDGPGAAEKTKTLFLFSDTFVGTVDPLTHQRMQANMLNNSVGLLDGGEADAAKLKFTYLPNSADVSLFTPKTPRSPQGSWYWLQDGIVIGDRLYIFPLVMVRGSGPTGFNFATYGVNMIRLPLADGVPDLDRQEQFDTPLYAKLPDGTGAIVFGAGIMDNTEQSGGPDPDGYIYVYGYRDIDGGNKQLVAARVEPQHFEQFDHWRYWDGEEWSPDILEAAALIQGVSPELSVTPINSGALAGKYLLVVERDTMSGYVAISAGDSPVGPFAPLKRIYYTPEIDRANQVFSYNAKAHPHLSRPGELLISYNVNSMDPMANNMNGDLYRPRWIRLRELGD
ncbi:F5/8 type C domain-containing protein [Paenibacillus sp. 32O-W]|uniref:discoidin domain-containing protein n=1 Tax=Paenibacillus sp. 32O-W TaxID=1695218 RepID=UPI00071F73A3|nr:discoidin domain-containing protein [Paenibacillus sp. 32O-W]ALS29239.1 F5/8 type C domain-containing protein [Paenibacillus sp. 32O-W]